MEINKDHKIFFEFYFEEEEVEKNPDLLENFSSGVAEEIGVLKTNLSQLQIVKNNLTIEDFVLTLFNNCEHLWDDDDKPEFKYPIFGNWVLDHYNKSREYFDGHETGLEQAFKNMGVCLFMSIKDKDGKELYRNLDIISSIDESKLWFKKSSQLISHYIDDFIEY